MPILGFLWSKAIWYLLGATKHKELAAQAVLNDKGYETYLPIHEGEPLISGYIFAKLDDLEIIRASRIMFLPELYEVPEQMMVGIFGANYGTPQDPFTAGTKVRITEGPWIHREAIIKAKQKDGLLLIISVFNQAQELPFDLSQVEAA